MSREYRPEGWKETELAGCKECTHYGNDGEINPLCWICHEAYDAGASAMLKALREKAVRSGHDIREGMTHSIAEILR